MKAHKNIKLIFGITFLSILVIPNIVLFSDSKRKKIPELSLDKPVESIEIFDNYYSDNYGLKTDFLDGYLKIRSKTLKETPLPNKVLMGKNGWYFLGNEHRNLFKDSFGNYSFSKSELETIKEKIKRIRDTLNSKGIAFHIVVPPNKHRVYPEKLPYRFTQKPTRLEVLNTYLRRALNFELLDLRDTLVANKGKDLLYYKTNTHWNDLGAYIGYAKTLEHLNLDVPLDSISNYTFEYKPIRRGDISEMINIKSNEKAIFLNRKSNVDLKIIKNKRFHLHFKNPNRTKKIIMYRDSFSNFWISYFNQSFGETVFFRGYKLNYDYIFNQKPDAVIVEIIERNLGHDLLQNLQKKPSL